MKNHSLFCQAYATVFVPCGLFQKFTVVKKKLEKKYASQQLLLKFLQCQNNYIFEQLETLI